VRAGNISATGNIAGTYFLGNGSQLTGLAATYGNANVAAYLSSGTVTADILTAGQMFAGNTATVVGNLSISSGNLNMSGGRLYVAPGNITGGNITASGIISAVGNITGNFFVGNGSQLTGIVGTYGNANVAGFLGALGSNSISTTGNVTSSNMAVGNVISAAGNITGSFVLGNGSAMTGIVTQIIAGSGISVNSATGNVTITNTGGGGGGGSNIANGTSNVSIPVASGNIDVFVANTRKLTINSLSGNFTGVVANTGIQCNSLVVTTGGITSSNGSIQVVGNAVAGEFLEATGFGSMNIGASTSGGANGNISIYTAGNVSIAASRTLDISGSANVKIPFATKTGTSTGLPGMITVDSNYIYVCTSSNVWKRAALSSF
jgi:hypothetical protein